MLLSEFLTEQVWAGTGGFVVLTSFHMMLTLLVWGPHLGTTARQTAL